MCLIYKYKKHGHSFGNSVEREVKKIKNIIISSTK